MLFFTELLPVTLKFWLDCYAPIFKGSLNILLLNEGGISNEPFDELAFTLRTVYRRFVGEGSDTICKAISSILRPSVIAIDSKSASFSAAS